MDDGSRLSWIIAILLLGAAAWLAVAETALASAPRAAVRTAADRGDDRAKKALALIDNFDRVITTILICTNITHITAAAVVTAAVTRIWGLNAVTVSTLLTTAVVFFAGEMLPKSAAKKYSLGCLLGTAGMLSFLVKLLTPFSFLLTKVGQLAARHGSSDEEIAVTEDELYDIIDDMTEEGSLDEDRGELISSALQFGDVTAESILTPRVDLTVLDVDCPAEKILEVVRKARHSRIPVYEGSIDNMIGVLQIRKYLKAWLKAGSDVALRPLLDEVLFVHSSIKIDELLQSMNARKLNMAVVTDNYGGTLGVVTVEDILEELVGEIWDEDDVIEETMQDLGDGEYLFTAEETVADMFDEVEFEDPEDDEELVNTLLGEWAYERLGGIPSEGDSFDYYGLSITVEKMSHNRILQLRVRVPSADKPEGGEV